MTTISNSKKYFVVLNKLIKFWIPESFVLYANLPWHPLSFHITQLLLPPAKKNRHACKKGSPYHMIQQLLHIQTNKF